MSITLGAALNQGTERLRDVGIDNPRLDARLLLEVASGRSRAQVIAYPEQDLSTEHHTTYLGYLSRRASREPVSRIIGGREFWGLSIGLNEETLDPRPDSETAIETLLHKRPNAKIGSELSVLDLGTGSGCLLLALLSEWPGARGLGVDQSQSALDQAAENAVRNGLEDRVRWQQNDWTDGLIGPFDVVISNPPYIPSSDIDALEVEVRDFDPLKALDGGADGLVFYRRSAEVLGNLLHEDGIAVFEIGINQADGASKLFKEKGFSVEQAEDLSSIPRCLIVTPPSAI